MDHSLESSLARPPWMSPASVSLLHLRFPIHKISGSTEVTHRALVAPSPCDATATSQHTARFCCSTCTGSIRRALDMTTASPLPENNLEHWQLPAITSIQRRAM